jgi:Putative Actinobacterial Holin-X, holin superfamily III
MSSPIETGPASPGSVGDRSLGELISEVTTDLSTLMRQELELARAELQQSASRAGKGAGMLGGAAVAGYFVLLFVSIALWWAIGAALAGPPSSSRSSGASSPPCWPRWAGNHCATFVACRRPRTP